MKKFLFFVILLLLLPSLLGLQRCTICRPGSSGIKRTMAAASVTEETSSKEEKQVLLSLDGGELDGIDEKETTPVHCTEGTSLEFLQNRCRETYPSVVVENPYVVQPVRTTSFKSFRNERDYNIEYSENIPGKCSPDYVFFSDALFRTSLLTRGDSILLENPALCVTSTDRLGKVFVETAFCRQTIDFRSGQAAADLSAFDRRDARFSRFVKDYRTSISFEGQQTVHSFTMDFPDEGVAYRENICRWLSQLVSESYVGDPYWVDSAEYQTSLRHHPERWHYQASPVTAASLGRFSSTRYFTFKKMQYDKPFEAYSYLISVYDWRLCLRNDRFLTYQQYIFDYDGGAHGGYSCSLRSYDFVHQEEIDSHYLFRSECMDSVKSLLLDEASCSETFLRKENVETQEQLYRCFARSDDTSRVAVIAKMYLPALGLSEEGVVFSYPLYAIGTYSSGIFHFVIPYGKLLPYLTTKAKWCLNQD